MDYIKSAVSLLTETDKQFIGLVVVAAVLYLLFDFVFDDTDKY